MSAPLYNRDILRLAASVGGWPLLDHASASVTRRSNVCGSHITIGLSVDANGIVTECGIDVHACALGQAAAAVLAGSIVGRRIEAIEDARDQLAGYLAGKGDVPNNWPGMAQLAPARDYPARHPSIRLSFEAAADAAAMALAQ